MACMQVAAGTVTAELDTTALGAAAFLVIVTVFAAGFFVVAGFLTTAFLATAGLAAVAVFAVVLVGSVAALAGAKLGTKLERAKVATNRKDNVFCIGLYTD